MEEERIEGSKGLNTRDAVENPEAGCCVWVKVAWTLLQTERRHFVQSRVWHPPNFGDLICHTCVRDQSRSFLNRFGTAGKASRDTLRL